MQKYRKKPVVIEAVQVTQNGFGPLKEAGLYDSEHVTVFHQAEGSAVTNRIAHVEIKTLEGTMRADLGDFIIRGVRGELYPIKEAIFRETYEPAE